MNRPYVGAIVHYRAHKEQKKPWPAIIIEVDENNSNWCRLCVLSQLHGRVIFVGPIERNAIEGQTWASIDALVAVPYGV